MAKARKSSKKLKDLKGKAKTVARLTADAVRGGRKSGEGQKDFLKVTMKEVM
jgi:hypothetical protein